MRRHIRVLGVGEQIEAAGMTQEKAAEAAELSPSTLKRMISGAKSCSLPALLRFARTFGHAFCRLGADHFRVTRVLPESPPEDPSFDEFCTALAIIERVLGCEAVSLQGVGYTHLIAAAEAGEAQMVVQELSRQFGRLFTTEEIEDEEMLLLRQVVLDTVKPGLTILLAYARLYAEQLKEIIANEKRAADLQLGQPA